MFETLGDLWSSSDLVKGLMIGLAVLAIVILFQAITRR